MLNKRLISIILCMVMLCPFVPAPCAAADGDKTSRNLYIHAQGENPTSTVTGTTVYTDQAADIYFAVDNPNKGLYEDGKHKEPQYDMNGYSVTIYYDPAYLRLADGADPSSPIDCTVPNKSVSEGETGEFGYYLYRRGGETGININGKTYNSAYVTVLFSGIYLPQKKDGTLWYNLCKLPLVPVKTGSTQVFFDTEGRGNYIDDKGQVGESLEVFAKDESGELENQTFNINVVNGGYHNIIIKDRSKPGVPVADPPEGSYTETQHVTLTAESGCEIWYSTNGGNTYERYIDGAPIEIVTTTTIVCYAKRISDGKTSSEISYTYKIIPKAPHLFIDNGGAKSLIPNIYSEYSAFSVFAADKEIFGDIEDTNRVYYTFGDFSDENISVGTDPESGWAEINKQNPVIRIDKRRTVRLITVNMSGEKSDVSEYHLGVKPGRVTADKPSGDYASPISVSLDTPTAGAQIFYTTDGSDPTVYGREYLGAIALAKDTTLRAAAYYDGLWGEISSFYYVFTGFDDYHIEAFYPSGVYDGSVNVTLTANNPEISVEYSTDGGATWTAYTTTLLIKEDTELYVRAVDKNGVAHAMQQPPFTYTIRPQPPKFVPESTQFTQATEISVFCPDSNDSTKDRYELYYTTDGSDPLTSRTRRRAENEYSTALITVREYTVIKAVVIKDGITPSRTVTQTYDIVNKKPARPLMTLTPGNYTRKIGDDVGFSTKFMPVATGTEIYYTISYDGTFTADPIPGTSGTFKFDFDADPVVPITVKGHTIIKAVAVNVFGVKSDVGIFEYIVTPEAPRAAPSATVGGRLPVVPVHTVKGCTVIYDINGFENRFDCAEGLFYLDTATGNAYRDEACTEPLGTANTAAPLDSPATLDIYAVLDGISSMTNRYSYTLSDDPAALAPPYADTESGEYEEIKADDDNNLLLVTLRSLNSGDTVQYTTDGGTTWEDYAPGDTVKIKGDTTLRVRSEKDGNYSRTESYVYTFVPLAPIITLPSGRYLKSENRFTTIELDSRAPTDKDYTIWYRENGGRQDVPYGNQKRYIDHTMSFKAYVINNETGRVSKNTINYYIIEPEGAATGRVYIGTPYDVPRISADVLDTGEYADGIKLRKQSADADTQIHYSYIYTQENLQTGVQSPDDMIYENMPITVNKVMTGITVTAWLTDRNGAEIVGSREVFPIEFVHLKVPQTSLGSDKVEFPKGTPYTVVNDYEGDKNILIYYTLDGTDPSDETNTARKLRGSETLTLDAAVTVKTVYMSACGKCVWCKDDKPELCADKVYGRVGEYKYTVPTVINTGGGGGGTRTVDNTRKYTKDIFGNEHPTHIGYIKGYPDGTVAPDGPITREEMTAILYRITNHDYEKPFVASGDVFPDVSVSRWSAHDIEYMSDKDIVRGYPDGEFKPSGRLTRAEFAALIRRFAHLGDDENAEDKSDEKNKGVEKDKRGENPNPPDLDEDYWAYDDIMILVAEGYMQGYEDGSFRPAGEITRAEVMTVVNRILGRNPSEPYVKSLDFEPFSDLQKDKWYYVAVLEATITHNYYLDKNGVEEKWEDWK